MTAEAASEKYNHLKKITLYFTLTKIQAIITFPHFMTVNNLPILLMKSFARPSQIAAIKDRHILRATQEAERTAADKLHAATEEFNTAIKYIDQKLASMGDRGGPIDIDLKLRIGLDNNDKICNHYRSMGYNITYIITRQKWGFYNITLTITVAEPTIYNDGYGYDLCNEI